MKRPHSTFDAGAGALRAEHFQVAYATTDIERAKQVFAQRFGIREFRPMQGQMSTGGHIHIELAWVGSTMYELVTASGPGSEVFMAQLPREGFALRHHHLGFLIHSDAEWQALLATVERNGWRVLSQNNNAGFMQTCMVEIPELGHCFEYLFPEPAGLAFLEAVPVN